MTQPPSAAQLSTLVGSRICHDLVNPLGAIGNGIELLAMAGSAEGPEMDLVSDSVTGAVARVKLLRLAFGQANTDQSCSATEVRDILSAVTAGSRLSHDWASENDLSRRNVRLALLAAMCVETALPLGGLIQIAQAGDRWIVQATQDRLNLDPALWAAMTTSACCPHWCPKRAANWP